MGNVRIDGNDIYDRNGNKIGYVNGSDIYGRNGNKIGYVQGHDIYDSNYSKIGYAQGDDIYDSNYSKIGTMDNVRESIEGGPGGTILVAIWFFFVRK